MESLRPSLLGGFVFGQALFWLSIKLCFGPWVNTNYRFVSCCWCVLKKIDGLINTSCWVFHAQRQACRSLVYVGKTDIWVFVCFREEVVVHGAEFGRCLFGFSRRLMLCGV